jgi:hypothetical protein
VLDFSQKPFLDHNSKFLVITTRNDEAYLKHAKKFLSFDLSILNFAILSLKSDNVFVDYNNNHGDSLELDLIECDLIDKLYPNQFKNVKSRYFIAVHPDPPRVIVTNGDVFNKYGYFFDISASMEQSKFSYILIAVEGKVNKVAAAIQELMIKRKIEFFLSSVLSTRTAAPKLLTYEETGSCVLVPNPEAAALTEEIFFLVNNF